MSHNVRFRRMAGWMLAIALMMSMTGALAQTEPQTDEEQGFFRKLWRYVEYLPVAMEDEARIGFAVQHSPDSLEVAHTQGDELDDQQDEEQGLFSSLRRGIKRAATATAQAIRSFPIKLLKLVPLPGNWDTRMLHLP